MSRFPDIFPSLRLLHSLLPYSLKSILFLTTLLPTLFPCTSFASEKNVPYDELRRLNKEMTLSSHYDNFRESRLDSAKKALSAAYAKGDLGKTWLLGMELAKHYRSVNTDSALAYSSRVRRIAAMTGDREKITLSDLRYIASLSTAGLFADARHMLDSLQFSCNTEKTRLAYWLSARLLSGYEAAYTDGHKSYASYYRQRYLTCVDSLMPLMPPTDNFRVFLEGERAVIEGRQDEALAKFESLLSKLSEDHNLYGMVCYQMAELSHMNHDEYSYAQWLAKGAISDIKANVSEGLALPALAKWLYEQGELDEAFHYVNFALEDASNANARMRAVSIAEFMPLIDEAYRQQIIKSRHVLTVSFTLAVVLLIVSIILLIGLRRQILISRNRRKTLSDTAKRMDSYMGHFIGLTSTYADRLDSLTKMVERKLATGDTAELAKILKSGKYSDHSADSFEEMFDKAFLDIYPDFVEKVNSLLRQEEQFSSSPAVGMHNPSGTLLSTELRICALVRLGVDDSQRIAQVLRCSVNTVYSYRNRMRSKAIDRASFDDSLRKLGQNE